MSTMRAVGVEKYGAIENLISKEVPRPDKPKGKELLVRIEAFSVNPIDTKVRKGTYDDAPDYYKFVPRPFHIIGFDGAGTVLEVGPACTRIKPGDEIFFVSPTTRPGVNSEFHLVPEPSVARKPKNMDFVEAAAMPLTYGTAYQSLVDRLEIKKGEKVGILIVNGAGGVGAMASQIARWILDLPVVITTASRPETIEFTKKNGATHVINHHEDLKKQIDDLKLDVPIKYIYITHSTATYLNVCADIAAPFGKVCSIVQAKMDMYGTQFLSKSLTFVWCWLGSAAYHGVQLGFYQKMLEDLADHIEAGRIKSHLTRRLKLDCEGIREAHRIIESGKAIGKVGLGISEGGDGPAFA